MGGQEVDRLDRRHPGAAGPPRASTLVLLSLAGCASAGHERAGTPRSRPGRNELSSPRAHRTPNRTASPGRTRRSATGGGDSQGWAYGFRTRSSVMFRRWLPTLRRLRGADVSTPARTMPVCRKIAATLRRHRVPGDLLHDGSFSLASIPGGPRVGRRPLSNSVTTRWTTLT